MATKRLDVGNVFGTGTTVTAYPRSNWGTDQPVTGAPVGSSATSAAVATSGVLTLTGLTAGTRYVAYAQVGSAHRYVNFSTDTSDVGELAYAEATSTQSGIGTSATDVTGLSISFTVGALPVIIEAVLPLIGQNTSTGQSNVFIVDGSDNANDIGRAIPPSLAAGGFASCPPLRARLPAGTGAFTAKVRAMTTAGTLTVYADGTAPSTYKPFIRAFEVY